MLPNSMPSSLIAKLLPLLDGAQTIQQRTTRIAATLGITDAALTHHAIRTDTATYSVQHRSSQNTAYLLGHHTDQSDTEISPHTGQRLSLNPRDDTIPINTTKPTPNHTAFADIYYDLAARFWQRPSLIDARTNDETPIQEAIKQTVTNTGSYTPTYKAPHEHGTDDHLQTKLATLADRTDYEPLR